jgi:hypothetical protein
MYTMTNTPNVSNEQQKPASSQPQQNQGDGKQQQQNQGHTKKPGSEQPSTQPQQK